MSDEPAIVYMGVYLGLGSNLGDRRRNLAGALRLLAPEVRVEAVSALYETDPVGPIDQPDFYNAVARVATERTPRELLEHVKRIERRLGREPGARWGAREIDIDILLYDGATIDEPGLSIPHPGLPDRAFVLVPLAELAPELEHPTLGRSVRVLADAVDRAGVRLAKEPGWERD